MCVVRHLCDLYNDSYIGARQWFQRRKFPVWAGKSWLGWWCYTPPPPQEIWKEWAWDRNSQAVANTQWFFDHSRMAFPEWQRKWPILKFTPLDWAFTTHLVYWLSWGFTTLERNSKARAVLWHRVTKDLQNITQNSQTSLCSCPYGVATISTLLKI